MGIGPEEGLQQGLDEVVTMAPEAWSEGLPWARGPGTLRWWGPSGWPRMCQRGWSGANPSVVSPRGRGCSEGTHGSTVLSGGKGSHGGSGRSSWGHVGYRRNNFQRGGGGRSSIGGTGRERGGAAHPGLKSASSAGLHHTKA